jgi:ribosomal protein L7/L12
MLFAVLEFTDFAVIGLLILVFAGGAAAATAGRPPDAERLRRVEDKLDLILSHLGVEYVPPSKDTWQELAGDPGRKIAAIKAYREQYGVGLAEAKKAVEDYIQGVGR